MAACHSVHDADPFRRLMLRMRATARKLTNWSSRTTGNVHIGSLSSELRSLHERSLDLGVRLKNRKLAETKLAAFVEEIVAPPGLVNVIIDGEFLLAGK